MSSNATESHYCFRSSGDSVPEIVLQGAEMLDHAQQVAQAVNRRIQAVLGQTTSAPDISIPAGDCQL